MFKELNKKAELEYGTLIPTREVLDKELAFIAKHWSDYETEILEEFYEKAKKCGKGELGKKSTEIAIVTGFYYERNDLWGEIEGLKDAIRENYLYELKEQKIIEDIPPSKTIHIQNEPEELNGIIIKCIPREIIQKYRELRREQEQKRLGREKPSFIPIKKIVLSEKIFSLIINDDIYISFKSKKLKSKRRARIFELDSELEEIEKERYERETKQFKILATLWEKRKEVKNGKNVNRGIDLDMESIGQKSVPIPLSILAASTQCSEEGARQHIKRLNEIFRSRNFRISIPSTGAGLFQLTIQRD